MWLPANQIPHRITRVVNIIVIDMTKGRPSLAGMAKALLGRALRLVGSAGRGSIIRQSDRGARGALSGLLLGSKLKQKVQARQRQS